MNKRDFAKHFGVPEFKSIAGKYYSNLIILIIIIFISILAIGLGKSSNAYLKSKMDNPFIKFINVVIPYGADNIDIKEFNNVNLKERFGYSEVSPIYFKYMNFMGKNGNDEAATARVIDENSEFYSFMINDPTIMLTDNYFSNVNFGCVVTKSYMKRLGYNTYNVPYIKYINYKTGDSLLRVPVAGVVSQLPDYTDILISKTFYNYLSGYKCLDVAASNHQTYLKYYIPELTQLPKNLSDLGYVRVNDDILADKGIIIIKNGVENIKIENNKIIELYANAERLYDFFKIPCKNSYLPTADNISFSFNHLDSIVPFQKYLYKKYKLKVDMNTIEAKENFNFFNKLSNLLSWSLIMFSIISIFIFTTNLILNHIDRNRLSLGTLKAFGLANSTVINIYMLISIALISIAFFISYLLNYIFGNIVIQKLIIISNINVKQKIEYINMPLIWLVILFIIIPIIIVAIRLRNKLTGKTPGDLIYDR